MLIQVTPEFHYLAHPAAMKRCQTSSVAGGPMSSCSSIHYILYLKDALFLNTSNVDYLTFALAAVPHILHYAFSQLHNPSKCGHTWDSSPGRKSPRIKVPHNLLLLS